MARTDKRLEELLAKPQRQLHVIESGSQEYKNVIGVYAPAVYIVRSGSYYKIGHTAGSVSSRVDSMQVGNPEPLVIVFVILTPNYKEIEKRFHVHFEHRHHRGEWFALQAEDEFEIETFIKNIWQEDPQN